MGCANFATTTLSYNICTKITNPYQNILQSRNNFVIFEKYTSVAYIIIVNLRLGRYFKNIGTMEKRILIAIDKFKGSLTSLEAAQAIKRGMERAVGKLNETQIIEHSVLQDALCEDTVSLQFDIIPIADGGDGSADVIKSVLSGVEEVKAVAVNPLGKEIETSFLSYFQNHPDRKCAFIEMAKVSGLALIGENERNPLITTTYGLGQLVKEAYLQGAREITLSIGGSATNDGGTGMLQALGFRFYNKAGELITDYMCGGLLGEIGSIKMPSERLDSAGDCEENILSGLLKECKINVVCDVTNPLLGSNGATYVYGPQKGATAERLQVLESGMENYVEVASKEGCAGKSGSAELNRKHLCEGAGAAGGVGYAVIRFLGGNLVNGWKFFAELTNLKERIAWADVIISGEGKIDSQSFSGKVIDGIFRLVGECNEKAVVENDENQATGHKATNKEVLLFCGINEMDECGNNVASAQQISVNYKIYSLKSIEPDTRKCIQNASELLEQLACCKY